MPVNSLPAAHRTLTIAAARRFLLLHHFLLPPRQLEGKAAILQIIRHLGCIQYDPVDLVGRNPDLALQARVKDYRPDMLQCLLYKERRLMDGWDKMASIFPVEDYPCFTRHRLEMLRQYGSPEEINPRHQGMKLAPQVLAELRQRGPLCSLDFDYDERVAGWWSLNTRLVKLCLDVLSLMQVIGIHHRVRTRRYFDLIERLLPAEIVSALDPFATLEEYHDWHVLRRIGGLGLALAGSGESWGGITHTKTAERNAALRRLTDRGDVLPVAVEGLNGKTFFLRTADLSELEQAQQPPDEPPQCSLLPPLDNLLWQRVLLRLIFGFDYMWEVYKKPEDLRYGRYVLPVLYGERFVARLEPAHDRKRRTFAIKNLWWEADVIPDAALRAALAECLRSFATYLGADDIID